MKIKPLRGKYLCEVLPDHKRTESGLYIADTVKEIPHRAKVLAAGDPRINSKGTEERMNARVGDVVHFRKRYEDFIEIDGKKCVFLLNEDIIGVGA